MLLGLEKEIEPSQIELCVRVLEAWHEATMGTYA